MDLHLLKKMDFHLLKKWTFIYQNNELSFIKIMDFLSLSFIKIMDLHLIK